MSQGSQCWSCGKNIQDGIIECPHCGMPIGESSDENALDFLDDLLDNAKSPQSVPDEDQVEKDEEDFDFAIPDMEYVEGTKEETSSPKGEFDVGYDPDAYDKMKSEAKSVDDTDQDDDFDFAIPDMDYVEGTKEETSSPKGEFDVGYDPDAYDKMKSEAKSVDDTDQDDDFDFAIPDMDYVEGTKEETSSPKGEFDVGYLDETLSPDINEVEQPSGLTTDDRASLLADMDSLFDEPETTSTGLKEKIGLKEEKDLQVEQGTVEEPHAEREPKVPALRNIGIKSLIRLFTTQGIYWALIFTIITFASYEITDPEFIPSSITANQFTLHPIGIIAAWISFLVMGWFYSYKLRIRGISPNYLHSIIYLATNFVTILLISQVLFITTGGSPVNYLLQSYYMLIPQLYIIGLFTGGLFSYLIGFKFGWEKIYELSPLSELEPSLNEL